MSRLIALAAGLSTLGVLPGVAVAAPVIIGQIAPGIPTAQCGAQVDVVQPTVTSGNSYVVPVGGVVVTAWSTKATTGAGQMLEMKVFRPAGGTNYTVVGHDGPHALVPSSLNTFSTRISVQPGDVLGDNSVNAATVNNTCDFPVSGETHPERMGDLGDNQTDNFTGVSTKERVNVAAVVRFLPAVFSVAPASGGIGGGTAVTIMGHDFTDASAVSFGGVPASSYTVNSDSSITASSPPESPGSVDISVTTPAGRTAATAGDRFTFAVPAVTRKKCVVPRLKGKTLKQARKALKRAHCKLGKIKGPKGTKARIKKQNPRAGTVRKAGSKVRVTTKPPLATKRPPSIFGGTD